MTTRHSLGCNPFLPPPPSTLPFPQSTDSKPPSPRRHSPPPPTKQAITSRPFQISIQARNRRYLHRLAPSTWISSSTGNRESRRRRRRTEKEGGRTEHRRSRLSPTESIVQSPFPLLARRYHLNQQRMRWQRRQSPSPTTLRRRRCTISWSRGICRGYCCWTCGRRKNSSEGESWATSSVSSQSLSVLGEFRLNPPGLR